MVHLQMPPNYSKYNYAAQTNRRTFLFQVSKSIGHITTRV